MTQKNAAPQAKSVLPVGWQAEEHFDVTCKQLPPAEPRVLQRYTILIAPFDQAQGRPRAEDHPLPTPLALNDRADAREATSA